MEIDTYLEAGMTVVIPVWAVNCFITAAVLYSFVFVMTFVMFDEPSEGKKLRYRDVFAFAALWPYWFMRWACVTAKHVYENW